MVTFCFAPYAVKYSVLNSNSFYNNNNKINENSTT